MPHKSKASAKTRKSMSYKKATAKEKGMSYGKGGKKKMSYKKKGMSYK